MIGKLKSALRYRLWLFFVVFVNFGIKKPFANRDSTKPKNVNLRDVGNLCETPGSAVLQSCTFVVSFGVKWIFYLKWKEIFNDLE